MKVFSAAAALVYGDISSDTIFYCENGAYRIGKNVVHDIREHGWLSLQQIIKYSSNIGAVKVGKTVGAKKLYGTLRDFGFGKKGDLAEGQSGGVDDGPKKKYTRRERMELAKEEAKKYMELRRQGF